MFSHYYKQGATRIDREYIWGDISVVKSEYIPLAFSDHMGLLTEIKAPFNPSRQTFIFGVRSFKIRNNVACDPSFKKSIASEINKWNEIKKNSGLDILT